MPNFLIVQIRIKYRNLPPAVIIWQSLQSFVLAMSTSGGLPYKSFFNLSKSLTTS